MEELTSCSTNHYQEPKELKGWLGDNIEGHSPPATKGANIQALASSSHGMVSINKYIKTLGGGDDEDVGQKRLTSHEPQGREKERDLRERERNIKKKSESEAEKQ